MREYKGKQREAVERAINSGVLNNTRRSHELVDILSKIEADKGIVFNYADNAKLKESGFALEGKTINGFVKGGAVTLNIQSAKAWESTVGHEVTHILEGTEHYANLQSALFKYAESKGELESRRKALTELYNGMDADVDAELTADLVGDYLFNDSKFIKNLTTNKNLFQKIYDEIKYLCKVATGKELTEIEKVKQEFDKAWKELNANSVKKTDGKIDYSVSKDSNGNDLSLAVQKRFANSKAVDENGSLKVLYHGTANGEFYTFDKSKGSVEGDFGSGFYFTDSEYDVEDNYEGGGPDFDNKVARRAEQIEQEEGIDYHEAETRAREELYKGGFKHSVYLNIENPAIVGETNLLGYDSFAEEYDRNDYDSDEDFESDVEYLISDKIDEIIWDIQRNVDVNSTDGIAEVLWNAINEGGIDVEQLKANINNLYLDDSNGNLVGNEVTRQIIESLGYDGIIDNTVSAKFNMNMEEDTTHYIVFKPNQIKSIENQNPTDNPDIRFSLSENKKSVDEITHGIIERLNNGEDVSIEEINSAPTISQLLDDAFSRPETYTVDTPERNAKRKAVAEKLLALGSAKVDSDGKVWYNSPVKQERRADVVIGLSGAGKSSVLVNPLSECFSSRIIDSDMAKEELDEFDNGLGANAVHRESQDIIKNVLAQSISNGDNIVYPIVGGGDVNSLIGKINILKNEGYSVYLHLNELPNSKAIGRSLNRYIEKGRFIPPQIIKNYGDTPTQNFNTIISIGGLVNGYSHYSNDVNRNESPRLIEISDNVRQFDERRQTISRAAREYTKNQKAERTTDNQIAPIKKTSSADGVFFDGENLSLSNAGEQPSTTGTPLQDLYLAPTKDAANAAPTEAVEEMPEDYAPMTEEEANALQSEQFESLTDVDAPPEITDSYYNAPDTTSVDNKTMKNIVKSLKETLYLNSKDTQAVQEIVQEYSTSETPNTQELFEKIKEKFGEKTWREKNEAFTEVKHILRTAKIKVSPNIKAEIPDYSAFRKSLNGRLGFSKDGMAVDEAYKELSDMYPHIFSPDIWNETDEFLRIAEVAQMDAYNYNTIPLSDAEIQKATNIVANEVKAYKENLTRIAAEDTAREALDSIAPYRAEQLADGSRGDALLNESLNNFPIKTVEDRTAEKIRAIEGEIADKKILRREAEENYNKQIENLTEQWLALKDKSTKKANNLVNRVSKIQRLMADVDADYAKRISDLEARAEKMKDPKYSMAMNKQAKMQEHAKFAEELVGDTSTWVDKKLGIQYEVNTERRNLRDIVRDENGNKDIARADAIDDALNGQYNRDEAAKKRELTQIREKYAKLKITKAEDAYIQMLGELRGNPDTTLTEKVVNEYYEKHKNKIDTAKVEKVLEYARQDYDYLLNKANTALREQGMKEIPYRQGYFPHFTEPKQNFVQKLLNWKTQDNEIPTSIAGLTEDFKPVKKYQSFDKQRHGDTTDYSFLKGFDNYSEGALDWAYHIDTLQKRRAIENHIRYTHSEEGIKAKIKEVYADENLDADEAQAQIEQILAEAKNPLNNFVQDFMTKTNILAGKKNSLDRAIEQKTNRKIYSVMTNVQNRMSANMVLANVRSALTNFIPITQSWAQVSPMRSLQATKDVIANAIKDDGIIDKSTFLTNRLKNPDNLYNTAWDKVLDKAGIMFEVVDNISAQVIWRSKYNDNLAKGMTESQAIKNADQFAENVMAGRSKGNEPTLFNAKNPLVKAFTMFQLEVNNQYGYLFKDAPNDLKAETKHWQLNLAKGYATAFVGAYVYNALMEQVAGSGAALDPIGIIEDLLRDLGFFDDDEEKEPAEVLTNLADNVVEELPFVGGLFGGGRIPISSALPYSDDGITGAIEDITEGNWGNIGKEMMNPLLNVGLPVGGGQIKKTVQGLSMFNTDEEHPIAGSYTDSGSLRFPVEDTPDNRVQAAIFGQYASENAREYFDNGYAPLKEKQIQEYVDVELPIADYWKYREGLTGLKTNAEKADYINSLDIEDWQKNLLLNNILDRKEDVDMSNYDDYNSFEEFDYAQKNPEKYAVSKAVGGYSAYKTYSDEMYDIKADKDENGKSISGSRKEKVINYINNLDASYEEKIVLFKYEYPADDTYNADIINYVNGRNDLTYEEKVTIYTELGFTVKDGYVYWD